MKIFNNNPAVVLIYAILAFGLSVSSTAYAQDEGDSRHLGFEKGKHEGHDKDNGKRKGHENERNPWHDFYQDASGVDFDLTVHNHAIIPNVTFTATYNSLMTIQELIADIVGDSTDGFYFQECFEVFDLIQGTISDCTEGETTDLMDSSLTLEEAGIVDDPEVHLVHIP